MRGLARLAGKAPDFSQDHDVLKVALIVAARQRGITWAQPGSVPGGRPDSKLAKKEARRLARDADRKVRAAGLPPLEVPDA